jgi:hypothetical protein
LISTPTAAGGVTGAVVVLILYVLKARWGIEVPGEVATALMVVITPLVHAAAILIAKEEKAP